MNAKLAEALTISLSRDVSAFLPELVLCGAIVVLLLIRLIPRYDSIHLGWVALLVSGLVCYLSGNQWVIEGTHSDGSDVSQNLFGGMLIYDNFTIFLRLFLYTFVALIVLTLLTGIPD